MTFQKMPISPKNIAVIGGGISGLGAAHALSDTYNVTLFEMENRLGGHARTILAGKNGDQPVDTGFIVFNYANYPELSKLFSDLNAYLLFSVQVYFKNEASFAKLELNLTSQLSSRMIFDCFNQITLLCSNLAISFGVTELSRVCLLYTSPSPRDRG